MTNTSARFWNRMAKRYAKSPVPDEAVYARKLEITRQYFRPDMQVLEIGCGTGTTALHHASHVRRILATDISERMLEIAKGKAQAQGVTNVDFEVGAIEDLAIAEHSMDMVMAHSILHLVEDREAVIGKTWRWLKPGGVLVVSCICMSDAFGFMRPLMPIGRALGFFPLVRFFSETELLKSITDAGFVIDQHWKPKKRAAVFAVALKPE